MGCKCQSNNVQAIKEVESELIMEKKESKLRLSLEYEKEQLI